MDISTKNASGDRTQKTDFDHSDTLKQFQIRPGDFQM